MSVIKRVEDTLAQTTRPHDARHPEQPKGVRHRTLGAVEHGCQVADAQLLRNQESRQDADPAGVAEHPEQVGQLP